MKKSCLLLAVFSLMIGLAGCSSLDKRDVGTGVGAVAGGVIGDAVFDSPVGMIGGAAVGAVAGNQIAKHYQ